MTGVEAFFARSLFTLWKARSFAHVKSMLQVPRKSIPVSWFTGKWVDYSFVLLESTRSISYSPYSVKYPHSFLYIGVRPPHLSFFRKPEERQPWFESQAGYH